MAPRLLPKGMYTPLPTFFDQNEDLDLEAWTAHIVYTARAGTIPVVSGSAGEAPHLTPAERVTLIKTARDALDRNGMQDVPIVAGVGVASTRESIQLSVEAADAGADFAMVIPPGYYAGTLKANGSAALKDFMVEIAEKSPIPIVVYNFPGVSSGIDLDSDFVVEVAKRSGNVAGVKLTCASVGKITRINAVMGTPEFKAKYPRKNPDQEFRIVDGFIDILVPSISSGAAGAISGLPNIAPRICVKLWDMANSNDEATRREAEKLQGLVALADGVAQGIGIPGLKMLIHQRFGYGPNPRRPLLPMGNEQGAALMAGEYMAELIKQELALEKQSEG